MPLEDDSSDFDFKFWKKVGPAGKFAAAWQMVCDLYKWNPVKYEKQRGLQRSVAVFKRREG